MVFIVDIEIKILYNERDDKSANIKML